MPGAGIGPENAARIATATGATEIHGSFSLAGRTDAACVSATRRALDR